MCKMSIWDGIQIIFKTMKEDISVFQIETGVVTTANDKMLPGLPCQVEAEVTFERVFNTGCIWILVLM